MAPSYNGPRRNPHILRSRNAHPALRPFPTPFSARRLAVFFLTTRLPRMSAKCRTHLLIDCTAVPFRNLQSRHTRIRVLFCSPLTSCSLRDAQRPRPSPQSITFTKARTPQLPTLIPIAKAVHGSSPFTPRVKPQLHTRPCQCSRHDAEDGEFGTHQIPEPPSLILPQKCPHSFRA